MSVTRLAILSTHPIQYQVPWFRALSAEPDIHLEVLYCHKATAAEQGGAGFGRAFDWDIPLLDGYNYRFLRNEATSPTIGSFGGLNTPEIAALISSGRYDAVMVHGWHYRSAWQAFRACWKTQTPVLVRGDSQLLTPRPAWKRLMKEATYRSFIPRFDACLAVGKRSREYFLHYGASPQNVFMVPHVVDEPMFDGQLPGLLENRLALRKQWNLELSSIVFAFVGKFLPVKRPMDFVQAVQGAFNNCNDVAGLMVGDGPLRVDCEDFVRAHKIPVKFCGFLNQSEIASAYVASDALVLPSSSETWGIVVNEAMRCGRPCFITDQVGCAPDMIESGYTGEIYRAGDIDGLAGLIQHYSKERAALGTMGSNARAHSMKFSIPCAIQGVLEAVDALQTGKGTN